MAFKVLGAGKDPHEDQVVPRVPEAPPSPATTVGEPCRMRSQVRSSRMKVRVTLREAVETA